MKSLFLLLFIFAIRNVHSADDLPNCDCVTQKSFIYSSPVNGEDPNRCEIRQCAPSHANGQKVCNEVAFESGTQFNGITRDLAFASNSVECNRIRQQYIPKR